MAEEVSTVIRLGYITCHFPIFQRVIGSDPDGEIKGGLMNQKLTFSQLLSKPPSVSGLIFQYMATIIQLGTDVHPRLCSWFDLQRAHILSTYTCPSSRRHVFNLGTGVPLSVGLPDKVDEVSGSKIQRQVNPKTEGDVASLYATAKKANSVLNWKPKHTDISFAVENVIYVKKKAPRATPRHQLQINISSFRYGGFFHQRAFYLWLQR